MGQPGLRHHVMHSLGLSGFAVFVHVYQKPGIWLILPCWILQQAAFHLLSSPPSTLPSSEDAHTHHYTMGTGETQGISLPCQGLKAACLHLTLNLEHLLTLCSCLAQCCATPKLAFMNSRRTHLDLTGVI